MDVNHKWDMHCAKQRTNHEREVSELRRRVYELESQAKHKTSSINTELQLQLENAEVPIF